MKFSKFLPVFFILVITANAFGGWVITMSQTDPDGETSTETLYIQSNRMKVADPDEEVVIFDLDKGEMIIINHEKRSYFAGNPSEFMGGAMNAMMKAMEEQMKNLPPEQQEMMKEYQKQMGTDAEKSATMKKVKVEIKKMSDKGMVAGYPVQKFQVYSDGEHKEDLWVTSKISIKDELDLNKLAEFMEEIKTPGVEEAAYSYTSEYIRVMEQGFPLKTVKYTIAGEDVSEASKVEKKRIPASEFAPPEGYKKVEMEDMMKEMMSGREK